MLRRNPIFVALAPELISSGIQLDRHVLQRPLWTHSANATFAAGKVRRRVPPQLLFASGSGGTVRGLSQQQANDGVRWVWVAVNSHIFRWYGPAAEFIATQDFVENETSIQPASFFDFTHYGDWTIINNGINTPAIHKPGEALANFGNAPVGAVRFMK